MEAVIYAAFNFLPPVPGFRVPALAKIMIFHVPNAMVASILSFAGAFYAIKFLKTRDLLDDAKSYSAASLALLFWILTTVTGMIFAEIQWGQPWNWDPKQSSIFILLLIFLAYFALRSAFPEGQKQSLASAGWIIFAAVTAPLLTYVVPNAKGVQSLHPQGVVFTMGGMGPDYRIIFWSATLGFLLLSVWIFRVSVALSEVKLRSRRNLLASGIADAPRVRTIEQEASRGGIS
jgi:heme exporter protein C